MYYKGGGSAFEVGPEAINDSAIVWAALAGESFSAPASWEGNAVPDAGQTALFQDTTSYTVSFPAGGLVATTVAGSTNGVLRLDALSLDGVTFSYPVSNGQTNLVPQVAFNGCSYANGVTVDFGHIRGDPLVAEAEGVIATYTGPAPDVASWPLTGLGGHRTIPTLRADDGNIYLTLEKTPAGTMLFVR